MARLDLVLGTPQQAQSALTEDMFGANYVYDYERIGDLPWERFDELIDQLGSSTLRYPGGNAVETRFNYLDPNSSVDLAGKAVMGMDDFISWAGANGISPTILLPTKPFLPSESHALLKWESGSGGWAIDPGAMAAAKALVFNLVETAVEAARDADTTIAAFELGNEFSGVTFTGTDGTIKHMNGSQYGLLADAMAQWVDEALESFNAGGDPQIVVQVWGDYNKNGINPTQLSNINDNVLAAFSEEGLAAIDATSSHIYFKEGKTTADGQFTHSYAGLDERIAEMAALSDVWSDAAGRTLDLHVTEWNVQKQGIHEPNASYWQSNSSWNVSAEWVETANFGMKQLAPMLEMVSAFNMAGVDAAQVWSVMYNAAALGMQHNGGTLTAAGGLFSLMQDILPGTHYQEVAAEQQDADVHVFRGDGQTHVFVSLRSADPHSVTVDLEALSPLMDTVVVTYLRPDEAAADGAFSADGNTYLVGDRSWLEADIGLIKEDGPVILTDGGIDLELGAYEVALISFEEAVTSAATPPVEISDTFDFTLEVGSAPSGAFGNKYDNKTDADGKITGVFSLADASKDLELSLTTFDVDFDDELQVFLNGTSLGYLDKTPNKGIGNDTLLLSSAALIAGENELTIQNENPDWMWGVNELRVDELQVTDANADTFDFTLEVGSAPSGAFGNKYGNQTDADGKITGVFSLADASKDLELSLTTFDVDFDDELQVFLNGTSLGYLDKTPNKDIGNDTLLLSSAALIAGENELTIQNENPDWMWGVNELRVDELQVTDANADTFDFTLEVGSAPSGAFGNKYGNQTDADGKITGVFSLADASKDLELSLTTFDVDTADELQVFLNGTSLGYLGTTANNGLGNDTLLLSSAALITGENELTIQNKNTSWIWGVNELQITDADTFDFTLEVGSAPSGAFGNKYDNKTDADGKITGVFSLADASKDLELSLTTFDVDFDDELQVFLNGTSLGYLDKTPNKGIGNDTLLLSSAALIAGENELTIQNENPDWMWGVNELRVDELQVTDANADTFDFTLEVGSAPSGAFGNKYGNQTDADGKITGVFSLADASKDLELSLTTFDVDFDDELQVFLNGTSLGYLDKTPNKGIGNDTLLLSSATLIAGENELTIQNENPDWMWGVNELQIEAFML